ncbi:glycosyltransferase [Chitinophaga pendula]|uniref:glycosyltransferase n=1 Tax=Chitinophaga TaxID=79328 RepID=UPI000BB02D35|nr:MULTISPECIES: glycosyltransferase [Chitinophaga]ASZ13826.1 phosphoheptose isomerase [Chitinophaga sp. MD30]UCJ08551.1 glycosyltransferase [Chitinophaga pendula]
MKKRIAFISDHASPLAALGGVDTGGQNVYVGELAKHLVRKGYEIDVFTRWENPHLPQRLQWINGVRIIHIDAGPRTTVAKEDLLPFMQEFTDNMISFIRTENISYKLVHANFFMSALVAAALKKKLHLPFVVTFHALGHVRRLHQGEQDRFPPERIGIEETAIREADQIIAECPQDKDDLMGFYMAPEDKITVIPCGFNPEELYPIDKLLARRMLRLPAEEIILLQLGRMVPRKGIDNVIHALKHIKYTGANVRLIVVGGEATVSANGHHPEICRLKQLAKDLGVTARVTFAGRKSREEIKYYYAAADLFITTPWYEPFGITPLEAMACGTPVIGADVGGIKYSVVDGKTGYLVPPNDPEALAIKINSLITDKALLNSMSREAIKRVNALFTWQQVANMVSTLYERILAEEQSDAVDNVLEEFSLIDAAFEDAANMISVCRKQLRLPIRNATHVICKSLQQGKKVLICGNGNSYMQIQQFISFLSGRMDTMAGPALPVIVLSGAITGPAAPLYDYDNTTRDALARQVEALGQKGDVLLCLSMDGQPGNIVKAMEMARRQRMSCVALLGKDGGEAIEYADVPLLVPFGNVQLIEEMHLHLLHTLGMLLENRLCSGRTQTELLPGTIPANTQHTPRINGAEAVLR